MNAVVDKLVAGSQLTGRCIVWMRGKTEAGYGQIWIDGKILYVHRLAHELFIGPLGKLFALHRCDTPACWNPDHLFAGTQRDNLCDMRLKNRHARGETIGTAKLAERDVLMIRKDPRKQRAIAAEYGIGQDEVSRIKNNKRWSHL